MSHYPMPITAFYAALCAIFLVMLSINVVRHRVRTRTALQSADPGLVWACRVHGNFCEYAPMVLILMAAGEASLASKPLLHLMGVLFLIGRAIHAYALLKEEADGGPVRLRKLGMGLTFTALFIGAVVCLCKGLAGAF